jgi:hypothetical protein
MKSDSHASDAPIHLVRDYKKIELACRPGKPPPSKYRASSDPDIITCTDCLEMIQEEIRVELGKFKPKCSCGRDDCIGDCPQADMACDSAREDRFFK